MVQTFRTVDHKFKGKICHFGKDELFKHSLESYYWTPIKSIDDEVLLELREKIYKLLLSEGFVFYSETPEFQIKTKFGNLVDFGIQFHHII